MALTNVKAFFMKKLLSILILFYSSSILSFSSVTGYIEHDKLDIHSQITDKALEKFGFSNISFRHIMAGNVSHDFYPNNTKVAEYHCDRNRGITNIKAAQSCKKAAHNFIKRSKEYVDKGKMLKALHFFGRSLHIFQDFISHSNYIDLNKKDKEKAFKFIIGKSKKIPNTLKLVGWDHKTKKGEEPGLLKGDFYPHDSFAKDLPNFNKESKAKLKSYKGATKFQAAYDEAINISIEAAILLKNRINKKSWEILKLTKHFN